MALSVIIKSKKTGKHIGTGVFDDGVVTLATGTQYHLDWFQNNGYLVVQASEEEPVPPPEPTSTRVADDYSSIAQRARELGARFI